MARDRNNGGAAASSTSEVSRPPRPLFADPAPAPALAPCSRPTHPAAGGSQ